MTRRVFHVSLYTETSLNENNFFLEFRNFAEQFAEGKKNISIRETSSVIVYPLPGQKGDEKNVYAILGGRDN